MPGVGDRHAAAQAVGGPERDRADDAVAELLLDLERQVGAFHLQRVVDLRHLAARELDVDDAPMVCTILPVATFADCGGFATSAMWVSSG
jgi:hypothetical protein